MKDFNLDHFHVKYYGNTKDLTKEQYYESILLQLILKYNKEVHLHNKNINDLILILRNELLQKPFINGIQYGTILNLNDIVRCFLKVKNITSQRESRIKNLLHSNLLFTFLNLSTKYFYFNLYDLSKFVNSHSNLYGHFYDKIKSPPNSKGVSLFSSKKYDSIYYYTLINKSHHNYLILALLRIFNKLKIRPNIDSDYNITINGIQLLLLIDELENPIFNRDHINRILNSNTKIGNEYWTLDKDYNRKIDTYSNKDDIDNKKLTDDNNETLHSTHGISPISENNENDKRSYGNLGACDRKFYEDCVHYNNRNLGCFNCNNIFNQDFNSMTKGIHSSDNTESNHVYTFPQYATHNPLLHTKTIFRRQGNNMVKVTSILDEWDNTNSDITEDDKIKHVKIDKPTIWKEQGSNNDKKESNNKTKLIKLSIKQKPFNF